MDVIVDRAPDGGFVVICFAAPTPELRFSHVFGPGGAPEASQKTRLVALCKLAPESLKSAFVARVSVEKRAAQASL